LRYQHLNIYSNRHQQAVIDYLIEENCVLKEQLEGQRLRFADWCRSGAERLLINLGVCRISLI
jgi:hypothetical protein